MDMASEKAVATPEVGQGAPDSTEQPAPYFEFTPPGGKPDRVNKSLFNYSNHDRTAPLPTGRRQRTGQRLAPRLTRCPRTGKGA